MKFQQLLASAALLAAAATASAQYSIVPAQPQEFDSVVLRMTVDSCTFDIDRIGVSARQEVFVVIAAVRNCLVPGPLRVIDVRLGTLPIGSYRVVLVRAMVDIVESPPAATIAFNVLPRPTIAIFPPPKRPLNDYTGNWIVPAELGWGLTILQSPADTVFAQLFVYGANRLPEWFTFQAGQWKSATRWEGAVYASTGPAWGSPAFDPAQVSTQPVGTATLEFEQSPGSEGLATLVYTVGNVSVTKRIRRFAF
jgi:hypothetical protein